MTIMYFYLGQGGRKAVLEGQKRMTTRVKAAVEAAGWTVEMRPAEERDLIPGRTGFHLVLNEEVPADHCLTLRRVGWEPFWRIERTNDRWDWEIADLAFDPSSQDLAKAARFVDHWRRQLFEGRPLTTGGGVFVPLQGKLTQRRHFQAASPIEMLRRVAARWPDRAVTATLHPAEVYSDAERDALAQMAHEIPNLRVQTEGSEAALRACDLVVTENSTMALKAYIAEKPVMLWARIDFHHIAASVPRLGQEAAFALVEAQLAPDYARYLLWYFRDHCLRSWDGAAEEAIRARLRALDWPI